MITDATRAILLESPGSLTMEVQDVPAICAVARERGIVTLLDNTWATPLLFPAIAAGVDVSILAVTKYVGGHADLMLGSATATEPYFRRIQTASWDLGHAVSPDDAWLASRGLRTMAVRLKQHEESALKIAQWLKQRPDVGLVLHPALPDCPGHEHWKRDYKGFIRALRVRTEGRKQRCPNDVRRQPQAVRDRIQLGRIRKPGDAGRSPSHRIQGAGGKSGAVAYRPRRSGRPDRRPRRRVRSGGAFPVDVPRLAVAADENLLRSSHGLRAADLGCAAPDDLGVVTNALDVS